MHNEYYDQVIAAGAAALMNGADTVQTQAPSVARDVVFEWSRDDLLEITSLENLQANGRDPRALERAVVEWAERVLVGMGVPDDLEPWDVDARYMEP